MTWLHGASAIGSVLFSIVCESENVVLRIVTSLIKNYKSQISHSN